MNASRWIDRAHALVALGVVGLFAAWVVVNAVAHPFYNWDLVGYVAAYLHQGDADVGHVMQQTVSILQSQVGNPADVNHLLRGNDYARQVLTDPAALAQQLPFYAPRVAYLHAMGLMAALGVPIVLATVLLSAIPVALICVMAWVWMRQSLGNYGAMLACLLMAAWLQLPFLAAVSTPDALSALFLVAGTLLYLRRTSGMRTHAGAVALLLLAIATRHDNVLHCVLLSAVCFVWDWHKGVLARRWAYGVELLAYALVFVGLGMSSHWPGMAILLQHTFVEPMAYPLTTPLGDTKALYLHLIKKALYAPAADLSAASVLGGMLLGVLCWRRASAWARPVMLAMVLAVLAKFLSFPVWTGVWVRMFVPQIVLFVLMAASCASPTREVDV